MNNWSMDNLKMDEVYSVSKGCWNEHTKEYDINYSNILTKLIQEAGRFCESYASDLFIDWETVKNLLKDGDFIEASLLFGFRKMGVDHTGYVLNNLENGCSREYYRSLWRLDIVTNNEDRITMTLGKINL